MVLNVNFESHFIIFLKAESASNQALHLSIKPSINNLFWTVSMWRWWLLNKILLIPTQTTNLSVAYLINKGSELKKRSPHENVFPPWHNQTTEALKRSHAAAVLVHQLMRLPLKLAVFHGSPSAILFSSRWGVRVPRDWITETDPAGHWITLCLTHRCVPASKLSSGSLSLSSAMANKCQD